MDVGALDRRVLVETPTSTRDGYGAVVPGWSTVCTVWGNVIPVTGTERKQSDTTIASNFYRVTIRYRTDVAATDRVTFDGKTANIRNIIELGRRDWLELFCEAAQ